MAYETGTSTSPGDLLVKLFDFLDGTGNWTNHVDISSAAQTPPYGFISSVGSPETEKFISLGLSWDSDDIRLHPNRGWTGSGDPASQTDVSDDAGYTSNSGWPMINNVSGPHTAYHFFESGGDYCHVVLEYSAGFYRHFGFGQLTKFGKWIGGEYYYGTYWNQTASDIDNPTDTNHHTPHDPFVASPRATHMFGLQNDGTAFPTTTGRNSPDTRWYVVTSTGDFGSGSGGNDGNGSDKSSIFCSPGTRSSGWDLPFLGGPNSHNGFRPLIPFKYALISREGVPDPFYFLGSVKDSRRISMNGLTPGQTISNAGDTWHCFPVIRKGNFPNTDTEYSYNWGIAYKEVP